LQSPAKEIHVSSPDAPIFQRLELRDFCGFSRFQIVLQPLTVLVGPNNGGKTTILRAVKFLTDCLELSLPSYRQGLMQYRKNAADAQSKHDLAIQQAEEVRETALAKLRGQDDHLPERKKRQTEKILPQAEGVDP